MKRKRIALFGGSFDPIHNGHTTVAADAAAQLGVDQLIFIPARRSPLKRKRPYLNDAMRVRLIELAIADNPLFELSTCELERPAPSYTLNTVEEFRHRLDNDTVIHWLIGADAVVALAQWYKANALVEQCIITTMHRAGCPQPDFASLIPTIGRDKASEVQMNMLPTPAIPFSSTDIRERIRLGRDVTGMLHASVQECIEKNKLYG